ncbi:hypothetical protein N9D31_03450 [Oligoflexaceae bacterium]|nr:hypothetical protein [Oligoflexaceae bacterium]
MPLIFSMDQDLRNYDDNGDGRGDLLDYKYRRMLDVGCVRKNAKAEGQENMISERQISYLAMHMNLPNLKPVTNRKKSNGKPS